MSTNTYTNERTALLFFSANGTCGGYYTNADGERLKVSGTVDKASKSVEAKIMDGQKQVGALRYKARVNPHSVIIADGEVAYGKEKYRVCATIGNSNGRKVHSIFPDQMPEPVDAPF